jgi:hypothetical protein
MAKEKVKKPFYKKWWVWLLAVIIIGNIANGGGEDETASTEPKKEATETSTEPAKEEEPKKEEAKAFGVGEVVKVGDLEYTVTGSSEVTELKSDNEYIDPVKTEGKLIVIEYTVKNLDKEARMVDGELFKLQGNGAEFEPMNSAEVMMVLGDKNLFLEEVNPQLSRNGTLVIEVPADLTAYDLQVSSGIGWSGGDYKTIKLK